MQDIIGQTIDRYKINSQLFKDQLSIAYKAYDPKFERNVVIYLVDDQQDQNRYFMQSVRTILGWRHVGIARIYDFGVLEKNVYMVQEHIPGPNLGESSARIAF